MSSPVSSKITRAPLSTKRSNARPTAGFAVMPLVASEPPQTVPTMSSAMPISARGAGRTNASEIHRLPSSIVRRVPPFC
jgi:hypothetical protein